MPCDFQVFLGFQHLQDWYQGTLARWSFGVWNFTIHRIGTASSMSPLALGSVRLGEAQKLASTLTHKTPDPS